VIDNSRANTNDPLSDEKSRQQPNYAREQQHPTNEPTPPLDNRSSPTSVEDLQSPIVDSRRHLFVDLNPTQQRSSFSCGVHAPFPLP